MKITKERRNEIRKNIWKWVFICSISIVLITIFLSLKVNILGDI
ncbi:hypothetical protein [Acinetobacter pittii]